MQPENEFPQPPSLDEVLRETAVRTRPVTTLLARLHAVLVAVASLLAVLLGVFAVASTDHARATRVIAELMIALSLLLVAALVHARRLDRSNRAAIPRRPWPAAALLHRIGDYWLIVGLILVAIATTDLLVASLRWIGRLFGGGDA